MYNDCGAPGVYDWCYMNCAGVLSWENHGFSISYIFDLTHSHVIAAYNTIILTDSNKNLFCYKYWSLQERTEVLVYYAD